jgi:5-methylcytosine-specific restriction endonuclease McrA
MKTLKPRVALLPSRLRPATTKELARLSGGAWQTLRERVLRRDMGICQSCRRAGHEVDHVVPLWAGGSNHEANLQVLCSPCHEAKSADEARQRAGGGSKV